MAMIVIGFTAIPLSLQPFNADDLAGLLSIGAASDLISNIIGYVPLGLVLAWRGPWTALALAALLSGVAEASQFFSPFRSPSLVDLATNVLGAAIGVLIMVRFGRPRLAVMVTPWRAAASALLALAGLAAGASIAPRALQRTMDQVIYVPRAALGLVPTNPHGVREPGRLEAHWTFDDARAARIADASPNGITLATQGDPTSTGGVSGRALSLNGRDQFAIAAPARATQLSGPMTISAWIKAGAHQDGNAAIVSTMSHLERGYEFYVTYEQDERTIAIQLGSNNGITVTRYGRTPLSAGRWHHIAAVYDARGTLRVFLDGQPDDGCLLGQVAHHQTVSGEPVHIGRHGEDDIDYFPGAIDDVRIFSRALSDAEVGSLYTEVRGHASRSTRRAPAPERCEHGVSQDPTSMGWLVIFGQLIALVLLGLRAVRLNRFAGLSLGAIIGLLIVPAVISNELLPSPVLALLLTLAGLTSIFSAVEPADAASRTLGEGGDAV